jgi:hypothetical protein
MIMATENGVNSGFGVKRFCKKTDNSFSWINREVVEEARQRRDLEGSRWSNINPRPTKSIQADNHMPKPPSKCLAELKNPNRDDRRQCRGTCISPVVF